MLLHSACHLLQSGELDTSLRDLTDLHVLMGHFGTEAGFWQDLVARAVALGVERPLYYALRFAVRLLRTPVPAETLRALASAAPASAVHVAMDILVSAAIVPTHPLRPQRVRLARALLSIRHHWLRMPPLLLMRHALHKALASRTLGAGSSVAL